MGRYSLPGPDLERSDPEGPFLLTLVLTTPEMPHP